VNGSTTTAIVARVLITTLIAGCVISLTLGLVAPELTDPYPPAGVDEMRVGLAVWDASLALGLAEGYW